MKPLRPFLAALWMLAAAPLAAQNGPVVVELFTSQGCSSCPRADALLRDLARRDDVLALALHVDYWDYIGWKDEYADPAHGRRQKGYARAAGRDMVYTPQMIVAGQETLTGTHAMELADLIARHKAVPPRATIEVARLGPALSVRVAPVGAVAAGPFDLVLVRYSALRHANITRGENAGRRIDYANVVETLKVVGNWDGEEPADFTVPVDGDLPAAVLVQRQGHGPILAAARVQ
ncbi:MAG: DUF1223 domain-containing protein [Jhaorihella sp.]